MKASPPASVICWRLLFLTLEAGLIFCFVAFQIIDAAYGRRFMADAGTSQAIIAIFFGFALFFLLIVSPFFLKSLRWVALTGWLIATGILLSSSLTPL